MYRNIFAVICVGVLLFTINACKKNNLVIDQQVIPPATAKFNVNKSADTAGTYYIASTGATYKIPIGITNVSDKDRTIQLCYSSTSAVAGQQYNAPATLTIPAGKALDTLRITGLYSGYPTSTKIDVLYIKICGGDVTVSPYWNQYKLTLRKYCDVIPSGLIGDFANSTDTYGGSPSSKPNYLATVSNWTSTGPTSATVIIKNLGATSDNGWGPFGPTDGAMNPGITATLDWSNPANFSVTIPTQNYFNDGSGNSTINATGTFSSCDQTYTITEKVKYAGNGSTYTTVSYLRR
ncbi:MAG: hypothetical protein ACM3VS_14330 [Candidatus Dadabacteria bacterium]